jgi:hypothetical protein
MNNVPKSQTLHNPDAEIQRMPTVVNIREMKAVMASPERVRGRFQ